MEEDVNQEAEYLLRELRQRKGLSQRDFARKMGMNRTHLQRLEHKPWQRLSLEELGQIAETLDMSVEELIQHFQLRSKSAITRAALRNPFFVIKISTVMQLGALIKNPKDFFVGTVTLAPQKFIPKDQTIQEKFVFYLVLEGNLLVTVSGKEHLIRESECFSLEDPCPYELYNPHQFNKLIALLFSIPSCVTKPGKV